MKALGIAHKTEHRAVRLGLAKPEDIRAAAAVLLARYPAVLVERLVPGGIVELLVGVQSDPVFGPVLSLGVGGVLAELVRDVVHLLLPVDAADIRRALLGLRCAPLLTGYRGAPPPTWTAPSTSSAAWPRWCWPAPRWSRWRSTR